MYVIIRKPVVLDYGIFNVFKRFQHVFLYRFIYIYFFLLVCIIVRDSAVYSSTESVCCRPERQTCASVVIINYYFIFYIYIIYYIKSLNYFKIGFFRFEFYLLREHHEIDNIEKSVKGK